MAKIKCQHYLTPALRTALARRRWDDLACATLPDRPRSVPAAVDLKVELVRQGMVHVRRGTGRRTHQNVRE